MKITKRPAGDIELEAAHGGSGSRKMLSDNVSTSKIEAMTDGFLPAGAMFDWHEHVEITEVMYVLAGSGKVFDEDGEYDYAVGDFFTFPADVQHKIVNTGEVESRMIFVRMEK